MSAGIFLGNETTRNYLALGEAVSTFGMEVRDAASGLGLMTRGFLWFETDIWLDTTPISGITTTWSQAAGAGSSTITNWTQSAGAGSSTITNWTHPLGGIFGEIP